MPDLVRGVGFHPTTVTLAKPLRELSSRSADAWVAGGTVRKLWIVAVLAAGVTAVLVSPASAAAKTHNLAGTITLEGQTSDALAHDLAVGGVCTGIGDFTDVHQGASVTIRNGSGRIIKVAPLGGGRASRPGDPYSGCVFAFNVKVSDTCCYVIKTPDGEEITYSKSALSRDKWQVTLGLGTTRD